MEVMELLRIVSLATLCGIGGTGIGGFSGLLPTRFLSRIIPSTLMLTAGLMTAVACFDLIPSALEYGSIGHMALGVGIGLAFMLLLSTMPQSDPYKKFAMLMLLSIALHNLPEGIAIGAGYAALPRLGYKLIIVILLHDIPEGMAVALPLRQSGMSPWKVFFLCIVAGMPTGLGAFVGQITGHLGGDFIAVSLGFAAGAMIYVTCSQMLPETYGNLHPPNGLWYGLGAILGVLVERL